MNRRRILRFVIGVGVASRALPLWAQAPAANMRRIGVLAPSTRAQEEVTLKPFFDEMRRLGWIEGQTIAYDRGLLLAYGPVQRDMFRIAATLVAKVLDGARPADLPIERPVRFALAINQRTANALGIKIPQLLLLRADEVFQ